MGINSEPLNLTHHCEKSSFVGNSTLGYTLKDTPERTRSEQSYIRVSKTLHTRLVFPSMFQHVVVSSVDWWFFLEIIIKINIVYLLIS